jgi:translation elongation factor EF-1alpha
MKEIAEVTHYFSNIGVAVIKLSGTLKVGDVVQFKGASTEFDQTIDSMQVEHEPIPEAKNGDEVGLKVKDKVRPGDKVLLKE